MESFDLAVRLRPVRACPLVDNVQFSTRSRPELRPVAAAVVVENPLNYDSAGGEPADRALEHRGGGDGGFVVVYLGVGGAGVIVDDGMDIRVPE